MPAYDATDFRPPAPVALVTVRSSVGAASVSNVPMLLDSGADVSLLPRDAIARWSRALAAFHQTATSTDGFPR